MRLRRQQLADNEAKIRTAMTRLLDGDIPPGGKCDIKTLAGEPASTALPSTALVPTPSCAPSSNSGSENSLTLANDPIPATPRPPASKTRSPG